MNKEDLNAQRVKAVEAQQHLEGIVGEFLKTEKVKSLNAFGDLPCPAPQDTYIAAHAYIMAIDKLQDELESYVNTFNDNIQLRNIKNERHA